MTGRHVKPRRKGRTVVGVAALAATTAVSVGAVGAGIWFESAELASSPPSGLTFATSAPTPLDSASDRLGTLSPPAPTASIAATPRPGRTHHRVVRIPEQGSGRFRTAAGDSPAVGRGNRITYAVEVEADLPIDEAVLARTVDRILGDDRGWTNVMTRSIQRVATDPDIRIRLATPATTDRLCASLETRGRLSCRNGSLVVLNAWRWANGADSYRGDLEDYRVYMVNHEFGHALGNPHRSCPGRGQRAPVMAQQTKGLDGCRPNPWPSL